MTKRFFAMVALFTLLGLSSPILMADDDHHDNGHGHGNKHGNKHHDRDEDRDRDHGRDNDQGWERRDGYEYRAYGDHDGRPLGWNQGRKTGWKNCGLPPGQAKKYGCRTYTYQGRPHYYYQDEVGRIVIRRPIIRLHAGVDIIP